MEQTLIIIKPDGVTRGLVNELTLKLSNYADEFSIFLREEKYYQLRLI